MNLRTLLVPLLTAPAVSFAGLVAWYPLDDNANDASGNDFHGTVVGGTVNFNQTGANGSTGDSAAFPNNGHIDVPYNAALNPASYTVTVWANASSTGGFASPVTSRDDVPATTVHGYILYNDSSGNWNHWTGTGGGPGSWNQQSSGAVTTNTWTHLAISYDAATSTKSTFVNGSLVSSNTSNYVPNGAENLHIGSGGDTGTSFFFAGNIDDVSIWDQPLSETQISSIMNSGVASVPEPSSMTLMILAGLGLMRRHRK